MALRSPSTAHSFWGAFATASLLPNVSGAPTQSTNLQAGDDAYVTAAGVRYVCTVPTLGILGGATWTAITPFAGGSVARNPIDANHTNVWYMGQGCTTTGLDILPTVGGVTLNRNVGTGTIVTGFGCFETQQSAAISTSTTQWTTFEASMINPIGTTQAFSLEGIVVVPQSGFPSVTDYAWSMVFSDSTSANAAVIRYKSNAILHQAATIRPGGNYDAPVSYGSAANQVAFYTPFHVMLTWDPAVPRISHYVNGWLANTTTTSSYAAARSNPLTNFGVGFMTGASIADVRISNIARPQSYAIAATQAMLAL